MIIYKKNRKLESFDNHESLCANSPTFTISTNYIAHMCLVDPISKLVTFLHNLSNQTVYRFNFYYQ